MDDSKPTSKYKTLKCSLSHILKDKNDITVIYNVLLRAHKIIIHTYQFLRLWILDKYHTNKIDSLPIIDENLIRIAFSVLSKEKICGPKKKGNNLKLYNNFNDFYNTTYKKLNYEIKIDGINLSSIYNYIKKDILTNIENNIKLNFANYINKFVNSSYAKSNEKLIEECQKGTKTALRKELKKDMYEIKQDLLNNSLLSNQKYHEWINTHKNFIFPQSFIKSYDFDIKINPQNYFKGMIYMCVELEKLEASSFQFFPLRTNIVPKYIPIDTRCLIELFVEGKGKLLKKIQECKKEVWELIFDLDKPIFNEIKGYEFDYMISTDCVGMSIRFIEKKKIKKNNDKKNNAKKGQENIRNMTKNKTQEEKEKYINEEKEKKQTNQTNKKLEAKEKKDKKKAEYKKLSKTEKEEIKKKYSEFPYIEELDKKDYEELKKNEWIIADPGKKNLLYMKNEKGKKLVYSNREYITNTKRLKYQRILQNYKKDNIKEQEKELSKYNSKSCAYEKFKEYVKNKNRINEELFENYENTIYRKYKWYGYINRKKELTNLVRRIKETFGKESIMIMGDWGNKMKINYMTTPNLGLKRRLAESMKVYNLDEFRTSCVNYKTEKRCENITLPDKFGKEREMHSILTYQMENKRKGCINRDNNATNNMIKIVKSYLKDKTRPKIYCRDTILE